MGSRNESTIIFDLVECLHIEYAQSMFTERTELGKGWRKGNAHQEEVKLT